MNVYPFLVFLHVLGAAGLFAAWGIEAGLFQRLRTATTTAERRVATGALRQRRPLGPVAMLLVLGTGIAMMAGWWGPRAWMMTALLAVFVFVAVGIALERRAMTHLDGVFGGEQDVIEPVPATAATLLTISLQVRAAIMAGIIGLMTIKPAGVGSLVIIGAASAIGLVAAARLTRRQHGIEPIQEHTLDRASARAYAGGPHDGSP